MRMRRMRNLEPRMEKCADYRIADPESAVVESAKVQLILLGMLMSDDAAKAKEVLQNAKPRFATREEYCAAQDALILDSRAVTYGEEGTATLEWK